jgi:type IV pilus assembly protein PilZ
MSTDVREPTTATAPLLHFAIRTRSALYDAWMPLLRGGGLFVPTDQMHPLGQEVLIFLTVWDSPNKIPLHGHVAYINFPHCTGNRPQGLGIQLVDSEASRELRKKVEGALAGATHSSRPTHTL